MASQVDSLLGLLLRWVESRERFWMSTDAFIVEYHVRDPVEPELYPFGSPSLSDALTAMHPMNLLPTSTRSQLLAIRSLRLFVLFLLGVQLVPVPCCEAAILSLEGVQVVPHLQSKEMQYRRKPDFSLGARVEVFLLNKSAEPIVLPSSTVIRLRGHSPEELLASDEWAWHDFPSAWGGDPLRLSPGTMTVLSWNGKRASWGTNTSADLMIEASGLGLAQRFDVAISEPEVWLSAVTFLGVPTDPVPDSWVFHVVNSTSGDLRLKACRLWLPESKTSWRALRPQPWVEQGLKCFPSNRVIPAHGRGGARVASGPLPLTYAVVEVRLEDAAGKTVTLWGHQRIKREVFDISGGWVHDTSGGGRKPLESVPFLQTLRRMHVNTAHIQETPGYTDQTAPDGLYTRYPLKYFSKLEPTSHYDSDAVLPRVHAVEYLGEPQYGGGKPVSPQDCWKALSTYAPTRLPTSVTHSEERLWRFYAGISDYPHYDAYRVTAPSPDAWGLYDRWNGQKIRWGAPLETIGEMCRSLRELNRPRPTAYWSQGPHHDWNGYGGRKRGSPTPDELRLQAYHALASRITSLYWFNLSLRSLVTFPDLIEPMARVGREIRMLEDHYLEGDAFSHERLLRDGKPDWDLDIVAGPRGAVLFALDLAYEADPEERVFRFGPARAVSLRFPLPAYLKSPAEVFRVDADGIFAVDHSVSGGVLTVRDQASRVAIYVASATPGERARLESRRSALLAAERSIDFDPARHAEDLAVLQAMVNAKSK